MSTPQGFKTTDVLRLEVERDPGAGEYRNLVANPSGQLGGWGWVTPVAHSVLVAANDVTTGNAPGLKYITGTTISPASNYFYSEPSPIAAGRWARARWYIGTSPYGYHRAYLYWYNASRTFISSDLLGAYTNSNATAITSARQAPAGTAFAALVFEVGGAAGTYPYTGGGAEMGLRDITLVSAATSTEANTITWANVSADGYWTNILGPTHELKIEREALNLGTLNATILDSSIDPATASLLRPGRRVRVTALNSTTGVWEPLFPGELLKADVTYDVKTRRPTDPKHARISLSAVDVTKNMAQAARPEGVGAIRDLPFVLEGAGVPWNADGNTNQVASATLASTNSNATAIDQVSLTRDTARGYAWVDRKGVLNAFSSLGDPDVQLVPNSSFETNIAGWRTQWVGAAATFTWSNLAASSGLNSLQMRANANALTTNMRIESQDATGTLASKIPVQAGLPYLAKADLYSPVTSRKAPVYVDWYNASNTYIGTSGDDWNIGTPSTVNTWKTIERPVVAPAGAVAAVMTVAVITEGTTKMAANEQHYVDNVSLRAATPQMLVDESAYADIDLGFDMDACINSIDYKWLVNNTFTGATDEYHLTGYEDAASIAQWGRHHKTFTIHGSNANAAAHAADVFARNAQPAIRPGRVQLVAMRTAADVTAKAFVDLYDLHRIVNTAKGINAKARVTTLSHTITPDRWLIALEYATPTAVAAPQLLPPVQTADPAGPPFLEAVYTPATAAVAATWVALNSWTVIESSQVAVSGSTITVARPGRYRIKATLVYDATGTAGTVRGGRISIGGTPMPYQTSPGYGTSAFASVEVDHTKRLAAGATLALEAYAGATVNLLGGTSGYGNTRIEIQFLSD